MTESVKQLYCYQIQYDVLKPTQRTASFKIGERIATYTLFIYASSREEAQHEMERQTPELSEQHSDNTIKYITELRRAYRPNEVARFKPGIEIQEHIIEIGSLVVMKPEQWNWIVREINYDTQVATLEDERGHTTQAKLNRLTLLPWKGGWFVKDGKRYFQMPPYPGIDY